MARRRDFKLRALVDILILVSVLTTLSVSIIVAYHHEKKSLTHTTFELNKIYADKMTDTVNGLIVNLKQGFEVTGAYIAKDMQSEKMGEILDLLQQNHTSLDSITLIDRSGVIINTTSNLKRMKGKKIAGAIEGLFSQHLAGISDPFLMDSNVLSIAILQPLINDTGEFQGALSGTISLHESNLFNTLLGDYMQDVDGTYAYVVSSSGKLIYHPDPTRIGEDVSRNAAVQDVLKRIGGVQRVTNTKGVDMLASYRYIKESGWGIIVQTPMELVLDDSRHLVRQILIYVVPILLAFLIVIYVVIGKMAEPLVKLANYAQRLTASNLIQDEPPRIHSWLYEANKLHKAFGLAVRHLRSDFDHLSLDAQTDALTGLYNRRTLEAYLHNLISNEESFGFLVIDIDRFKLVNDKDGHEMGDRVLQFVAATMQAYVNSQGACFRYGGEEFVILLPNMTMEEAMTKAECMRKLVESSKGPKGKKVTLSIGVASYPETTSEPDKLFELADKALYRAKNLGRNRVEGVQKESLFVG